MPNSSPLMGMPVPVIGPTGDPGPAWATYLNQCLGILDSHDHTSGNGAQVPTNGININSDLNFNSNNVIGVRSYRCVSQGTPLATMNDRGCIYDVNGDLYWNNGSGTAVQVTSNTAINIPLIVSGVFSTSPINVSGAISGISLSDYEYARVHDFITMKFWLVYTIAASTSLAKMMDITLPFAKTSGNYGTTRFMNILTINDPDGSPSLTSTIKPNFGANNLVSVTDNNSGGSPVTRTVSVSIRYFLG